MIGTCSEFGGKDDQGMNGSKEDTDGKIDSGLAHWEPWEADRRPDMFYPEDPGWLEANPDWVKANPGKRQPTWARLKTDFFYIALRDDFGLPRNVLQNTPFKIKNLRNGDWVCGFLVDRGPGIKSRLVDLSPGIMQKLGLDTDDMVEVTKLPTELKDNA